jgi:2-deoxy-D-gluconate 3-dehydrogenase
VERTLAGKVAVVTGGGRGIGRAIALGLAQAGADVAVIGRSRVPLEEVKAMVDEHGGHGLAVEADLTDVHAIRKLFDDIERDLGPIDVLVNSAGVQITGPALAVTEEDWDRTIDANLKALFFSCQAAGKGMLERGHGKIINLASTFSVTGFAEFAAYCASKGGVLQLTRALAAEWAGGGVNVNAIGPTATKTAMNEYLFDDPAFLDFFLPKVPAGRVLQPEDLVGAALFLASPGSDMVHGHLLLVDAGYSIV